MAGYFGQLKDYMEHMVRVVTTDGNTYQGRLIAIDNQTNIVLGETEQRIIQEHDSDRPNTIEELGVLMLRGDLVLMCGLVDEAMDADIDWMKVRGGPIGSTKNV